MLACPPNLTYSFFTVCEIITFKVDKKVFFHCPRGTTEFWRPKELFSGAIFEYSSPDSYL
jgi:hypothetical protein